MESGTPDNPPTTSLSGPHILYSDHLIEISADGITFRKYYFPIPSDKFVPYSEIDHIDIRKPTIYSGKWRLGGTSSPGSIWFPLDWHRPSRDRIFRAALRNGNAIGFTVEDSARVTTVLRRLGLIGTDETAVN
jgi:hypothetical protein